jgi:hypothetical protein
MKSFSKKPGPTQEIPMELRQAFLTSLGASISSHLKKFGVSERKVIKDFKTFKNTHKSKTVPKAEEIACKADKGEDVSGHFTNNGKMMPAKYLGRDQRYLAKKKRRPKSAHSGRA